MSWHLDDLDAVLEFDASDDLGQLVFALQAAPGFGGGGYELEDHELGGLGRQRSFGAHGSMTHGCEHALDRVCNRYEDGGADFPPWFLDRGLWCDHPGQRHREHEGVGRPFLNVELRARVSRWPPLRLARLR